MIESRRMPTVTASTCSIPASSGPRWTIESHIRATRLRPSAGSPPATPQIPHIRDSSGPERLPPVGGRLLVGGLLDDLAHHVGRLQLRPVIRADGQLREKSHQG